MATYTEQLAEVNAAITKVMRSQEAESPNGARVRRADLQHLLAERKRLEPLAAREGRGGGISISRGGTA